MLNRLFRLATHRTTLLVALASLGTNAIAAEKLTTAYPTLTTATALKVAEAALHECQKQGYVVGVAVVDRGGAPLALLRDNLAGAHTPNTAIGKAWTAVSFSKCQAPPVQACRWAFLCPGVLRRQTPHN